MTNTICIIDGDPLKYSVGFSVQETDKDTGIILLEPVHHAYYNLNSMVKKILNRCETDQYEMVLTKRGDKTNFRYAIYPKYKESRLTANKPVYYDECHDYIYSKFNAVEAVGEEADDLVSIKHYEKNPFGFQEEVKNTIICSIDKDFNNCAGWHYNWRKDALYFVSEIQALRNFYLQILTGDPCDDIPRIKKGWRKGKIEQKLDKAATEDQFIDIIKEEVYNIYKGEVDIKEYINRIGSLVWLRRKKGEIWALRDPEDQI